ncbi:MAG TPA: hypothetical protein PKA05_15540, partial [Roseiflexaceae bacterium]|nr:hypothetical protein [Roseiflexaceae bacterium]
MVNHPLYRQLDRLATDRWARRGLRILLRASWLGLALWCLGFSAQLLLGWPISLPVLGALALICIGIGLLYLLRRPLDRRTVAHRLDRRFGLNEQLVTALEVAQTPQPPGSVAAHLVLQSGQTIRAVRQYVARHTILPLNDLVTLLALLVFAGG